LPLPSISASAPVPNVTDFLSGLIFTPKYELFVKVFLFVVNVP
jgi:hypothetical protein